MALNYALPNMNNLGCRLYSESDLYQGGTGAFSSCQLWIPRQANIFSDFELFPFLQVCFQGAKETLCKQHFSLYLDRKGILDLTSFWTTTF